MNVARLSRQILLQGMTLAWVGLIWGFVAPLTPYPRLGLTAHIQFMQNGLLYMALGVVLLAVPHGVGSKSLIVMLLSAVLTWLMLASEVANAWWGTREILPIAAAQAGATGGTPWQEALVKVAHIAAGAGLIVAWTLLIVGFLKRPAVSPSVATR